MAAQNGPSRLGGFVVLAVVATLTAYCATRCGDNVTIPGEDHTQATVNIERPGEGTRNSTLEPAPSPEASGVQVLVRGLDRAAIVDARVCLVTSGRLVLPLRCGATDEAGRVELADIPAISLRVWAATAQHGPTLLPALAHPPYAPGDRGPNPNVIELAPTDAIASGVVVDASGGSIDGAQLRLRVDGQPPGLCTSGDEGRFTCTAPRGSWSGLIDVEASGYARFSQSTRLPISGLRLALLRESSLRGIVVDGDGAPVGDVQVGLRLGILDGRFDPLVASTDEQGRFVFRALEPGIFRPFVDDGHYRTIDEPPHVRIAYASASEEVRLVVRPGHRLEVRVFDPDALCSGPSVALRRVDGGGEALAERLRSSPKEGAGLQLSGVASGSYEVECTCLNGIRGEVAEAPMVISGDTVVECRFDGGAVIRGRVVDPEGEGVSQASVNLEGAHLYANTDESGAFALGGLSWGDKRIRVAASGYRPSDAYTVHLAEGRGPEEQVIVLSRGVCLEGRVIQSEGLGEPLTLYPGTARSLALDTSGEFTLCGLVAGDALSLRVVGPSGPLLLSRQGDAERRSREYTLRLEEDPPRVELLVDTRSLSVDGEVHDSNDQPLADILVLAAAGYPRAGGCTRPSLGGSRKAATHAEGDFTLAPLAPGPWMIYAEADDGAKGCAWLELDDGSELSPVTVRVRP